MTAPASAVCSGGNRLRQHRVSQGHLRRHVPRPLARSSFRTIYSVLVTLRVF